MNSLVDRYLVEVLDRLPEGQRSEVGAELRASITDMVDALMATGEEEDAAVRAVLTDLGDPKKLARSYDQRPQYLIGPTWFPTYIDLVKTLVPLVGVILAALTLVLALADGESFGNAIGGSIATAFQVAVQIAFWVTLTFALIDRFSDEAPEEEDWTVSDLPKASVGRQIGLATTAFDVTVSVVLAVAAIVQAQRGIGAFVRGVDDRAWLDMPFFNPDLPLWVVVVFFLIVLLGVVAAIVRHRVGYWTPAMLALSAIEAVVWIGFVAIVTWSWPILNPAFGEEIDPGGSWWETGGEANLIVLAVVVISSGIDLWEAWKGHQETTTRLSASASPA